MFRWRHLLVAVALVAGYLVGVPLPAQAADPCAPPTNPIACENSKPGTDPSMWDVDGAGDSTIQGFATDSSVNVGNSISFKIKTSPELQHHDLPLRLLRGTWRPSDRRL